MSDPAKRKYGKRGRMKRGWPNCATVKTMKVNPPSLTVTEFMEWLQELANDKKWKSPTPWDEHTFRVGVQMSLKRITHQPNT